MKTDRKADTVSASAPLAHDSDINHRKRKASRGERRSSTTVASAESTTLSDDRPTAITGRKKRASIDEHRKEEERQYTVEVSGNMRKKRVLASPRATSPHRVHPRDVEPEEADSMASRKRNKNGDDSNAMRQLTLKAALSRGHDVDGHRHSSVNGDTKSIEAARPDGSTPTKASSGATEPDSKAHRSTRSRLNLHSAYTQAGTQVSPTITPSAPEQGPQKRVLPSRSGMLQRPTVPAGEYILYLGDKQVLQRAIIDPSRVPPAAYGGGSEELHPVSTSTKAPVTADSSAVQSAPPPSIVTHIEVPIFRPCRISQFLQEEKKRKLQLLSKMLAKAEEDAATGTHTSAHSLASTSSRSVSTRLKHKGIVQNQHVSVQMAIPSLHTTTHGKKSMMTNTTLGRIEGITSDSDQEEILTDEVYEKRHKKHEMAEKKFKNREKEKLRHAMYQQQLVVEKLRHIEINRLMPISAFRSLQKTVEQEQQHLKESGSGTEDGTQHAPISLAAARIMQDEYHRRLLREAEENLRRYEQLGLHDNTNATIAPAYTPFSRTRNRLASMAISPPTAELRSGPMAAPSSKAFGIKHDKGDGTSSNALLANKPIKKRIRKIRPDGDSKEAVAPEDQSHIEDTSSIEAKGSPTTSSASHKSKKSATSAVVARTEEPPRPPKPITTFIKPGSCLASGARKSSRVSLAFGEKVPILDKRDFVLPLSSFKDLLLERAKGNVFLMMELKRQGLESTSAQSITADGTDLKDEVKDQPADVAALSSPSSTLTSTLPNQ
ncbi:hypothetical protein BGX31_002061 [Mortierella sp. GBA43]|nr:hypothetical protein BGX31_002061 [Mortierella sp. GBA43]